MTLETLETQLAVDAQHERHALWRQGHTLCLAIVENAQLNAHDPRRLREGRAQIFAVGARMLRCTLARVRSIAGVVATFGSEPPYEQATYTLCRAVMAAAHRLGREPRELLKEAIERDWSEADVQNLGKTETTRLRFRRKCPECGGRVGYQITAPSWPAVVCGLCISRLIDEGGEVAKALRDVPRMGVLA